MKKQSLELSTRLAREDVAGVIEALVEGLKEGSLHIQKSGEKLELAVPRVIDLEVTASLTEKKAGFSLDVSWLVLSEEAQKAREDAASIPAGAVVENIPPSEADEAGQSLASASREAATEAPTAGSATKKTAPKGRAAKKGIVLPVQTGKSPSGKAGRKPSLVASTMERLEDTAGKAMGSMREKMEKVIDLAQEIKTDAVRMSAERAEHLSAKRPVEK